MNELFVFCAKVVYDIDDMVHQLRTSPTNRLASWAKNKVGTFFLLKILTMLLRVLQILMLWLKTIIPVLLISLRQLIRSLISQSIDIRSSRVDYRVVRDHSPSSILAPP